MRSNTVSSLQLLLGFLFLFILVIPGISTAQEPITNSLPESLKGLLNGSSTDTAATLSFLEDEDLPAALAITEALKFQAVHGESGLKPADIAAFKKALESRLSDSKTVSFQKTEDCTIAVPEKEVAIGEQRIKIPPFFTIPWLFRITDQAPKDEAGTVLPDVWVKFKGGKQPIEGQMLIDEKLVGALAIGADTALYRPVPKAESALSMGKHCVKVKLTDANGRKVSTCWSFTVGEKDAPGEPIPNGSTAVGSFNVPLTFFHPGSRFKGSVRVNIYQTARGERRIEYLVYKNEGDPQPIAKTTSLAGLRKFTAQGVTDSVSILPKSPYAPIEKAINFSFQYTGTGAVEKAKWKIQESEGTPQAFEGNTVSWVLKKSTSISLQIFVNIPNSDPEGPPLSIELSDNKSQDTISLSEQISRDRDGVLTDTGTGTLEISGQRTCYFGEFKEYDLKEETTIPIGESGRLVVKRARWFLMGGSANVTIEEATASKTNLLFKSTGFVEVAHEIKVVFEWGPNEKYPLELTPKISGLYGVFEYHTETELEKMPPGIIAETVRLLKIKKMSVTIQKQTRPDVFNQHLDEPIILGKSNIPGSKPLQVDSIYTYFIRKTSTGFDYLNWWPSFTASLGYSGNSTPIDGVFLIRCYFAPYMEGYGQKKKGKITRDLFQKYYRPIIPWQTVKAYPSAAGLLSVQIKTATDSMYIGQKMNCEAMIVPNGDVGTGFCGNYGNVNTLDILKGYKIENPKEITWKSFLDGKENARIPGRPWEYLFAANLGTGTYDILATATMTLKESDTGSSEGANAQGSGAVKIEVKDGLQILSPANGQYYPMGFIIEVKTSLDNNPEEWRKINWKKGILPWNPGTTHPPAKLEITQDVCTLSAVYTTPDNIPFTPSVTFFGTQISLAIEPNLVATTSERIPLKLTVKIGGKKFKPTQDPLVVASFTRIQWWWKAEKTNDAEVIFKGDIDQTPMAEFHDEAALTILATATIKLIPSRLIKNQERVATPTTFILPIVRADLWKMNSLEWTSLDGHFATQALSLAGRTFLARDGTFKAKKIPHTWNESGIKPEFKLEPAIKDPKNQAELTAKGITFSWLGPENQTATTTRFMPFFQNPGNHLITLDTALDFGLGKGQIPFKNRDYPVHAKAFEEIYVPSVYPASFTIIPGGEEPLFFYFALPPKKKIKTRIIPILDGAYKIELKEYNWFLNDQRIGTKNPFTFSADEKTPLKGEIKAQVKGELFEGDITPGYHDKNWSREAAVPFKKDNIILKITEISFLSGNTKTGNQQNRDDSADDTINGNRNKLYDRAAPISTELKKLDPPQFRLIQTGTDESGNPVFKQDRPNYYLSFARTGAEGFPVSTMKLKVKIQNFSTKAVKGISLEGRAGSSRDGKDDYFFLLPEQFLEIPALESREKEWVVSLPSVVGKWESSIKWSFHGAGSRKVGKSFTTPPTGEMTVYTTWGKSIITGYYGENEPNPPESRPAYYLEIMDWSCQGGQNKADKYEVIKGVWERTKNLAGDGFKYLLEDGYPRGLDNLLALQKGACGEFGYLLKALFRVQGLSVKNIVFNIQFGTYPHPEYPFIYYVAPTPIPVMGNNAADLNYFYNHFFVEAPALVNGVSKTIVYDASFLHPPENYLREEYEEVFAEKFIFGRYDENHQVIFENPVLNPPGVDAIIDVAPNEPKTGDEK